MKEYYYAEMGEAKGPYSIDELRENGIKPETFIWKEGMSDWLPAKELKDIAILFRPTPPPIPRRSPVRPTIDDTPFIQEALPPPIKTSGFVYPKYESNEPQGMFSRPFSDEGRIRRWEYVITWIIFYFTFSLIYALVPYIAFAAILYVPLFWLLLTQGAKRCHDLGNSGWSQLIPFYVLWMLFEEGVKGTNQYGPNPKDV
jgi:uncharacterized membrane protein YhaH (DUF805 family)